MLGERVKAAERAAAPLSPGAVRYLQRTLAEMDVIHELVNVGIDVHTLERTPVGRADLRAMAGEYGITGAV